MLSWLYEETQVDILVHNWLFFAKEIPYGLVFCSSKSFFSSALQGKTALLKYGTGQELNKQQLYFLVYAAGYLQNPNNMWLSCNNITYAGKGKKKKKAIPLFFLPASKLILTASPHPAPIHLVVQMRSEDVGNPRL